MIDETLVSGVVTDTSGSTVKLVPGDSESTRHVEDMGAQLSPDSDSWLISYSNKIELGEILMAARDAGFAFSGGESGWPPSATAEHLRDNGLFSGPFVEIVWRSPEEPVTRRL